MQWSNGKTSFLPDGRWGFESPLHLHTQNESGARAELAHYWHMRGPNSQKRHLAMPLLFCISTLLITIWQEGTEPRLFAGVQSFIAFSAFGAAARAGAVGLKEVEVLLAHLDRRCCSFLDGSLGAPHRWQR